MKFESGPAPKKQSTTEDLGKKLKNLGVAVVATITSIAPTDAQKPKEKELLPIYVTDKNDPRLKAYQDSLVSYNNNEKFYEGGLKILNTASSEGEFNEKLNDLNRKYPVNNKIIYKKLPIDNAPVLGRKESPEGPLVFVKEDYFKKPIQPVIYRPDKDYNKKLNLYTQSKNRVRKFQEDAGESNIIEIIETKDVPAINRSAEFPVKSYTKIAYSTEVNSDVEYIPNYEKPTTSKPEVKKR